jgi:hypothetical protein
VTVNPGASLLAIDSTIQGPVSAASAGAVHIYDTEVRGPLSVTGATGSVAVVGATVRGPVALSANTTPGVEPIVAGNTIRGPLACSGNSPAPINLGEANDVSGPATGECGPLD